jgi:hypothetical protein
MSSLRNFTLACYPYHVVELQIYTYRDDDKSLARPTSRSILSDGENISFGASLVIYIYIYIYIYIGYMKIKIFFRCSLFPSWSG